MKKNNILKENREFNRIISKYKPIYFKYFVFYVEKNTNDLYKFGISVSKKIGKAVVRNKIKRRIKNIIDKKEYENNFKCIIIVKKSILDLNFNEMEQELFCTLKKLCIIKGDKNEEK